MQLIFSKNRSNNKNDHDIFENILFGSKLTLEFLTLFKLVIFNCS